MLGVEVAAMVHQVMHRMQVQGASEVGVLAVQVLLLVVRAQRAPEAVEVAVMVYIRAGHQEMVDQA
jgi:hypothetical protein